MQRLESEKTWGPLRAWLQQKSTRRKYSILSTIKPRLPYNFAAQTSG